MNQLILTRENSPEGGHRARLLDAFVARSEGTCTLYRTYSGCYDGPEVQFVTSSPEIHSVLGTLSRNALIAMSEVLDDELRPDRFSDPKKPEIIFGFPKPDGEMGTVTVSCYDVEPFVIAMKLSPLDYS
jgi:hypothetical protein